jgi:hypothetical protein
MNIIHEIIEFKTAALKAGIAPTQIKLSAEQKQQLEAWFDSCIVDLTTPEGLVVHVDPFPKRDKVLGMEIL